MNDPSSSEQLQQQRQQVVRPTEAQLRWAQFHHKRRAVAVKQSVQKLWLTPANVKDVEGAFSEDGNTTCSSAGSHGRGNTTTAASRREKARKPTISRGRRALLRVAKRRFEKRRADIERNGYYGGGSFNRSDSEDDGAGDELAAIFAEETFRKKRRRRHTRMHRMESSEEERVRRFEDAFHATMMNLVAAQPQNPEEHIVASKIWTRPDVPAAETIDGRHYSDLKWGVMPKESKQNISAYAGQPDRSASWLVHMPSRGSPRHRGRHRKMEGSLVSGDGGDSDVAGSSTNSLSASPSHVPRNFRGIVSYLQERMSARETQPPKDLSMPMMRLSKYFDSQRDDHADDEKKDDDSYREEHTTMNSPSPTVKDRVATFSRTPKKDSSAYLDEISQHIDQRLIWELENLEPGSSKMLFSRYLSEVDFDPDKHDITTASQHLEVVARRYLVEIRYFSGQSRQTNPSPLVGSVQSPEGVVKRFAAQIDRAAESGEMVATDGRLHKPTFALLVRRYLEETTQRGTQGRKLNFNFRTKDFEMPNQDNSNHIIVNDDAEDKIEQELSRMVERIVKSIETSPDDESLIEMNGVVDRKAVEDVVARYLAVAAGVDQATVHSATNLDFLMKTNDLSATTSTNASKLDGRESGKTQISMLVKYFSSRMEQVLNGRPIISGNGGVEVGLLQKVAYESFEFLREQPGQSQGFTSPQALSNAKKNASALRGTRLGTGQIEPEPEVLSNTVAAFVHEIESAVRTRIFVDEDGQVCKDQFEAFICSSMQSAMESYQEKMSIETAGNSFVFPTPSKRESPTPLVYSPYESDFFGDIRADQASVLDHQEAAKEFTEDRFDKEVPGTPLQTGRVAKLVGSMTSKVEGFWSKRTRQATEEEVHAVAAFRKTQGDRQVPDDTSSMSSFNALPDGIKNAVKRLSGKHLSPQFEEAHGEHTQASDHDDGNFQRIEISPSASTYDSQSSVYSPDRAKLIHQKVMERSALIGHGQHSGNSIIDTDGSDISGPGYDPQAIASLLLSPTLLTKRHKQAISAVEAQSWEQVSYLLSANPWLAEMTDLNTNQYLLHKLALYGAIELPTTRTNTENVRDPLAPSDAPMEVNTDLIRMFPSAVHKFDKDGNLPLHMAAVSANFSMVKLLGDRFPSGASVRNQDGMLPLHLCVLACSSQSDNSGDDSLVTDLIKVILDYFPGALAIPDDEGNLPIHTAAMSLKGRSGAAVVYVLLDAADRERRDPNGVRFRNKLVLEDPEDVDSIDIDSVMDAMMDVSNEPLHCTMVFNEQGQTPLDCAVESMAGSDLIEAIAISPGGIEAAVRLDGSGNNCLHLLLGEAFWDPAAALSIVKVAPEAVKQKNLDGVLPIELACMHSAPEELILGLVLADLPISLEEFGQANADGGATWWYLNCECDDHYVTIVEDIVSMCSYEQVRRLGIATNAAGYSVISRASRHCKYVLERNLLFAGRFEFIGNSAIESDPVRGVKVFDANDFGDDSDRTIEGRHVRLECYSNEGVFLTETAIYRDYEFDRTLLEEAFLFTVGADSGNEHKQFCVAIERPNLTLEGVVQGMLDNLDCQEDASVRKRYGNKVFAVLRLIAKALRHLHAAGIVHGALTLPNCGKYGDKWKLSSIGNARKIGEEVNTEATGPSPPEVFDHLTANKPVICHPSQDTWGFGQLAFEVLVGEPLRGVGSLNRTDDSCVHPIREKLRSAYVPESGVELVLSCLSTNPESRPPMEDVLKHKVWREIRRQVKIMT